MNTKHPFAVGDWVRNRIKLLLKLPGETYHLPPHTPGRVKSVSSESIEIAWLVEADLIVTGTYPQSLERCPCYGAQPRPLPPYIPVGTRFSVAGREGVTTSVGKLDDDLYEVSLSWLDEVQTTGKHLHTDHVDWSMVPMQPDTFHNILNSEGNTERVPAAVAEVLLEARKYRPECVVEQGTVDGLATLIIWRSTGNGIIGSYRDWCDGEMMNKPSFGAVKGRSTLTRAVFEDRVWPHADAERMVIGGEVPSLVVPKDGERFRVTEAHPQAGTDPDPYLVHEEKLASLTGEEAQRYAAWQQHQAFTHLVRYKQGLPEKRGPWDWDCNDGDESELRVS